MTPGKRGWSCSKVPRLKVLLRFLRATSAEIFKGVSTLEVEDMLRRAYGEVLIDQIDILREYCSRQDGSERHAALVRGFEKIRFLPGDMRPWRNSFAHAQDLFSSSVGKSIGVRLTA